MDSNMTSIEEINGITATAIYKILGYSADAKGLERSILNDVKEYLKDYNLEINYTENYFFEEFWFYFFTTAQLNAEYPIIQFGMNIQLTPKEISQTDIQSVYTMMRNLAFSIPSDRAKIAGINLSISSPTKEFEEFHDIRFHEYSHLIKDQAQDIMVEPYINNLSESLGFSDNELVRMAIRYSLAGKLKYYYGELKRFVLSNL